MTMPDKINDKHVVIAKLQGAGIIPTQQRLEIAQFLFARPQHVSAEQLMHMINEFGHRRVSKATVYNTLNLFAERGIVREVIVDPSRVYYDSNITPHHHFYNVDTGELSDVGADAINVDSLPAGPQGTQIEGIDVVIRVRSA